MTCCKTEGEDGCCKDLDKNSDKSKGGKTKMEKNMLLWGVIGVLFIVALILMFQSGASGSVQSAGSAASSAASSYGGMVGGC